MCTAVYCAADKDWSVPRSEQVPYSEAPDPEKIHLQGIRLLLSHQKPHKESNDKRRLGWGQSEQIKSEDQRPVEG